MFKIGKKNAKLVLLWILGFLVLIAVFVGGVYFGKNKDIPLVGDDWSNVNENKRTEIKKYDLSRCDETTANIVEELSDSVVTVAIKKMDLKRVISFLIFLIFFPVEISGCFISFFPVAIM